MKTYRVEVDSAVKTVQADFFTIKGEYAEFWTGSLISPNSLVAVVRNPNMVKELRDGDAEA